MNYAVKRFLWTCVLALLCSSCGVLLTGSREPESIRRLLVILDQEGQNYKLKGRVVLFNADDEPQGVGFLTLPGSSTPVIAEGARPVGLQSDFSGSRFYLGEPSRVVLYGLRLGSQVVSGKPVEEASFVKVKEIVVPSDPLDATPCLLQNFRVTANAAFLIGLVQCGSSNDASRQRLWVYSLNAERSLGLVISPDNTQFIQAAGTSDPTSQVLPGAFPYAISSSFLYFVTPEPGNSQRSRLYTLDLNRNTLSFPSGYQPKSVDAIYALDTVDGLASAATLNGVRRINDLGELGDALITNGATRIWSTQGPALTAAAFWSDRDTFNNTRDLFFRTNVVNKLPNVLQMQDLVFLPSLGLSFHLEASNLVQTDLRDLSTLRLPRTFSQTYSDLALVNPRALAWVVSSR